jgi:predicted Rossmann fold flavoprotein
MKKATMDIGIIGGGAAGFFSAIRIAELNPLARVFIFERGRSVLEKVRISGGGRCNVTHDCSDPIQLIGHYPRGGRELLGPFTRFGPNEVVEWFSSRGVELKTEPDGRVFPKTNNSQTIVDCLIRCAQDAGVVINQGTRLEDIQPYSGLWKLKIQGEERFFSKIVVATGSNPMVWTYVKKLGHTIINPVPSLFTFNCKDTRLRNLSGISVSNASVQVKNSKISSTGPVLVTHWGFSGPAILKLSSWGARHFAELNHRFSIQVCWENQFSGKQVLEILGDIKRGTPKKLVHASKLLNLPLRLSERLAIAAEIDAETRWGDLNNKRLEQLAVQLTAATFEIFGKSTFKEEFVTAGGIHLAEVNFKTFESKIHPGLFFAGEVLDIDAITGGFNFQAAWTGGWIVGSSIGDK